MNVDVHLIPRLGAIKLQQLMPAHLRSMYADLQADGGRRDGRPGGLSPRTVQLVHVILHKALRDAVRDGKLSRNVGISSQPPKSSVARFAHGRRTNYERSSNSSRENASTPPCSSQE